MHGMIRIWTMFVFVFVFVFGATALQQGPSGLVGHGHSLGNAPSRPVPNVAVKLGVI